MSSIYEVSLMISYNIINAYLDFLVRYEERQNNKASSAHRCQNQSHDILKSKLVGAPRYKDGKKEYSRKHNPRSGSYGKELRRGLAQFGTLILPSLEKVRDYRNCANV